MLNPKLKPFGVLVGEWRTVGTHPALPGTTLQGRVSFAWIEEGAFLLMHTEVETEGFPRGVFIFGSDDSSEVVLALYFDERGVSRIYQASLDGHVWKLWRNAPGFSQRFSGVFADNNTIHSIWELSRDDSTWARDFELTYTRVS
jgi:hypothetical protein